MRKRCKKYILKESNKDRKKCLKRIRIRGGGKGEQEKVVQRRKEKVFKRSKRER